MALFGQKKSLCPSLDKRTSCRCGTLLQLQSQIPLRDSFPRGTVLCELYGVLFGAIVQYSVLNKTKYCPLWGYESMRPTAQLTKETAFALTFSSPSTVPRLG